MSKLLLNRSDVPSNLNISPDVHASVIESDLYNICGRIKDEVEGGDLLDIVCLRERDNVCFTIMELTPTGPKIVMKVGRGYPIDELDARVITRLQYMLRIPFQERIAIMEKENKLYEERYQQYKRDELYERVGGPMRHQLIKDGFVDTAHTSFPLTNRGARRARNDFKVRNGSTPTR